MENRLIHPTENRLHPRHQSEVLSPVESKILKTLRSELGPVDKSLPVMDPGVDPRLDPVILPIPSPLHPLESPVQPQPETSAPQALLDLLPARMLNEFVYCPRLFYYEHVDGVFVESADTLRGQAIHQMVDSGSGAMPAAKKGKKGKAGDDSSLNAAPEVIHSRSVQLSSPRLGVIAKLDLVETWDGPNSDDLFANRQVCPVDYKAGSPREVNGENELWDTDKIQLGLQILILRDNGYHCEEGVIYYRGNKQRVRLTMTLELETWIQLKIDEARNISKGPIPPPLVDSPKCVRCSLAPVCLPDETRLLKLRSDVLESPRRLIAPRDDLKPLYLNTQGYRVGCSDEVLQVKEKDALIHEIRIRDVSHVALFGNIQITTQAIQVLCELDVPVTYFSMGGWFYGVTRGHQLPNVLARIQQHRCAADPVLPLALARQFVYGKIRNQRTLLMRNHVEPPPAPILRLKRSAEDALEASSIPELLGIEGSAASVYFEHFSGMLRRENAETLAEENNLPRFDFQNRNRRPPTDPVNAALSLAYSLLSKDCTLAATAVGLDPYVGFYHQPRPGRPALALDLMEEFRPIIADSVVITAINNRILNERDFVTAGNSVNLSPAGRKNFFQAYEQRMDTIITHPIFEYKVTYRRALELQARLLAKHLTGEIPAGYQPFMTR